jgi:hypothetical protein
MYYSYITGGSAPGACRFYLFMSTNKYETTAYSNNNIGVTLVDSLLVHAGSILIMIPVNQKNMKQQTTQHREPSKLLYY